MRFERRRGEEKRINSDGYYCYFEFKYLFYDVLLYFLLWRYIFINIQPFLIVIDISIPFITLLERAPFSVILLDQGH